MKKILFCIIVALYPTVAFSSQHEFVAKVNNGFITNSDLNNQISLVIALTGMQDSAQVRKSVKGQVLQSLVNEKLLEDAANQHKIEVTEKEITNAALKIAKSNNMKNVHDLYNYIKSKGSTVEQLKQQLKAQIVQAKLFSAIIEPQVQVTELELQESTKEILNSIKKPDNVRYNIAEIVLSADEKDVDKLVTELQVQLAMGADFAHLANEFSQSISAERGGEVGWLMKSQLPPEIAIVISKTPVGAVTPPIKTEGRYYIIKVLNKKGGNGKSNNVTAIAPEQVRAILWQKKADLRFEEYVRKLRSKAFIKINLGK